MTQLIHKKIDKFSIAKMPTECFNGRIFVVNQNEDAKNAINSLMSHNVVGFDTETKPSFKKGRINKVALLQIATHDEAFLFQLNSIGITDDIMRLLEDKNIVKVGLSISDDIRALTTRRNFTPRAFVDIQTLVKHIGIEDMGLQKIYANLFGLKISKNKQLSNWNTLILDEKQKKYAALDAFACIHIYDKVMELIDSHNFIVVNDNNQSEVTS